MKLLQKYHTAEYWKGGGFPLVRTGKAAVIKEEAELIQAALIQLLNTGIGERVMYPTFGSRLKYLLFDPNDQFLAQDIEFSISDAINRWEPRVIFESAKLVTTDFRKNNNIVDISISFRLRNNPSGVLAVTVPILMG